MNKFVILFLSSVVIADAVSVAVSVGDMNEWNSYKVRKSYKIKSLIKND